jgi:hypothetical protein
MSFRLKSRLREAVIDHVTSDTKLRAMRPPRLMPLIAALAAAGSCTSRETGSGTARAGASGDATGTPSVVWFDGMEPMILTPAHSNDRAVIVAADSLAPDLEEGDLAQPGALVRLDGTVTPVRVAVSGSSEGCVDAALQPAPSAPWGIGFVGQTPTALRVDSIRAIPRQDSLALAPIIFRLASSIPNAPGGRFAGLPFSLGDLWRIRAPDGSTIIAATTKRQINQEDSPAEERTLLIAETDASGNYNVFHSSRSAGAEETVEGSELIAVVTFPGRSEIELLFSHDYGAETSYSVVERVSRGNWKIRWVSRRLSC